MHSFVQSAISFTAALFLYFYVCARVDVILHLRRTHCPERFSCTITVSVTPAFAMLQREGSLPMH